MRKFVFGGSYASAVPLLLDLYPATAAYSLRKLRTAYTGAAIRVRRSSDNTEQDIGFVGVDLDTASLLSFVGAGDGFVNRWYDQQGTNNAITTLGINQPIIVSGGVLLTISGTPRMDFDGINDVLSISTINFTSSNYQSFVGKRNASGRRLMALGGVQYLLTLWTDNKYYLQNSAAGFISSNATDSTTNQLLITGLRESGGTQRIYKNNVEIATTFTPFILNTGISEIGRYNNSNAFLTFASLQETIYYNTDQSANRTAIETNINTYYGIY